MLNKPYLTTVADEATALLLENTAQGMVIHFLGYVILLALIVLGVKVIFPNWKKLHLATAAASIVIILLGGMKTADTVQFAHHSAQNIRAGKKITSR